jgi:hypothetical protein
MSSNLLQFVFAFDINSTSHIEIIVFVSNIQNSNIVSTMTDDNDIALFGSLLFSLQGRI